MAYVFTPQGPMDENDPRIKQYGWIKDASGSYVPNQQTTGGPHVGGSGHDAPTNPAHFANSVGAGTADNMGFNTLWANQGAAVQKQPGDWYQKSGQFYGAPSASAGMPSWQEMQDLMSSWSAGGGGYMDPRYQNMLKKAGGQLQLNDWINTFSYNPQKFSGYQATPYAAGGVTATQGGGGTSTPQNPMVTGQPMTPPASPVMGQPMPANGKIGSNPLVNQGGNQGMTQPFSNYFALNPNQFKLPGAG